MCMALNTRREAGCRYQLMKATNIAVESTFAMGTQRGIGFTGSDIQAVGHTLYGPRLPDKLKHTLDPKQLH